MVALEKWLRRHDDFLKMMEASAEAGVASVQALQRILTNPSVTPTLDDFIAERRRDKQITTEIHEMLCRGTNTALDREDIEALSGALYRIPKTVEKFAERYILTVPQLRDVDFSRQLVLLTEAAQTVLSMIQGLRAQRRGDNLGEENRRLQHLEGEADKVMLQLLRELYSASWPPLKVVLLKDLYELLEKALDRCRDAGNVAFHISLRHASVRHMAVSLFHI